MQPQSSDFGFLLQNLMDNLSDAIYFKDRQSRFIRINRACAEKHGFKSLDAVTGKTDFDVFTREHAEQAFADEQRIVETGEPLYGIEEKETWPDGSVTWVSTTKMPLKNAAGEIIGTFGMSRDITEHKEAELRGQRYAEEMELMKEEIEDEIRMAGELQKTFFPRTYPVFPEGASSGEECVEFLHRFHPCGEISGDYCSILRISDTEAGIFLCDVSGTGVRAALGTALIRGIVQEIAVLGATPGAFLSRMNELLFPLLGHEGFLLEVTACYLVLDASSGMIRLANANHPLPLHFQDGHGSKWLFEDRSLCGVALAAQADTHYNTIECQIEPDDAVVLFTDGLFSVQNILDAAYGEKRLLDSAHSQVGEPLEDIFRGLEQDALAFSDVGKFTDDVCIVGLHLRRLLQPA
jgi:sigma-B regulation protein RsbU (phosphoserine phosphatase)